MSVVKIDHNESDDESSSNEEKDLFIVLGAYNTSVMGDHVEGHNCDFEYTQAPFTHYHIILQNKKTGQLIKVTIYDSEGECGSGWTTASFGNMEQSSVDESVFEEINYVPRYEMSISSELFDNPEEFECCAFSYSANGDDHYYPSGYVTFKESQFVKGKFHYDDGVLLK